VTVPAAPLEWGGDFSASGLASRLVRSSTSGVL
jgi:hypothetical protein